MPQPNRLRALRKAKKLSLEALSAQTGKAFQTISEYERGLQVMPEEFLMKAGEVLECSSEEILQPEVGWTPSNTGLLLSEDPFPYRVGGPLPDLNLVFQNDDLEELVDRLRAVVLNESADPMSKLQSADFVWHEVRRRLRENAYPTDPQQ